MDTSAWPTAETRTDDFFIDFDITVRRELC